MIMIDANLLIYAHDIASNDHDASREWVESVLSGTTPVLLSWSTIHAFLRLTTHATLFRYPRTTDEAIRIVDDWLGRPVIRIAEPGPRYWTILRRLLHQQQVRGRLVTDAHIAALAIEHGATLYTADRDFDRFAGLQVRNPLTEG